MMPQNRKPGFNPLPDRWQAAVSSLSILFGDQQTLIFFKQLILQASPAITEIANHRLKTQKFSQGFSDSPVSVVSGRRNDITNLLFSSRQNVEFETEKPSFRRLSEIRTIISEESHAPMPRRLADRNRLGIDQINSALINRSCLFKQLLHNRHNPVQSPNKLLVSAKLGKLFREVCFNQRESFPQTFCAEFTLHQSDCQNFGIRQRRLAVSTAPPVGNLRILPEKIINEAVDFTQFIKYLFHWLSVEANRFSWSIIYFTTLYFDNLFFSNSDWG